MDACEYVEGEMMDVCTRCEGCGKIANDEEGSAWTHWENLPEESKLAIKLGLIYPIACPACGGTGKKVEA